MDEPLIMVSPLHPEEVLARLTTYGKEWRESKIPAGLRAAGIHRCQIAVENDRFRLHFNPQGRQPGLVWIGRVSASDEGSRIDALWVPTRWSRASNLFALAFLTVLWGWFAFRAGVWWVVIIGLVFVSGMIAFATASAADNERGMCASILAHVTDAKAWTPAPAA